MVVWFLCPVQQCNSPPHKRPSGWNDLTGVLQGACEGFKLPAGARPAATPLLRQLEEAGQFVRWQTETACEGVNFNAQKRDDWGGPKLLCGSKGDPKLGAFSEEGL